MRTVIALLSLLIASAPFASSCELGDAPREAVVKKTGLLNTGSGGASTFETSVLGGQAVFVKVQNASILGAGVVVTISSAGEELCSSALVILPERSQTFSSSVFSGSAVRYDVTVEPSEGSEVIANITVLALPEPRHERRRKGDELD